jgi:hypothetical protein
VRNRWAALAVVFLARLSMGFQVQSIAAVGPLLVYYTVYYLGMATALPLAGLLRDVTGSAAAPLFFAAALMAATVPALVAFRRAEPGGRVAPGGA